MIWKLDPLGRTLELRNASGIELDQLNISFTRETAGARFDPRVKAGVWDGKINVFKANRYLPSGLWGELVSMCEKYNWPLEIEGSERLVDMESDESDFRSWVKERWADATMQPRDYQVDTAWKLIRNRSCLAELATSAGKSLIAYLTLAYLLDRKGHRRILMVVPTVDLVIQATKDFTVYNDDSAQLDLKIEQIYSGTEKVSNANLVIGTYQSLVKRESSYLDGFDVIHASPPCQGYSTQTADRSKHQRLIPQVRERLQAAGVPYVIENVVGAPLAGNGGVPAWTYKEREARGLPRYMPDEMDLETWKAAMGIDWNMSREGVVQAIPPTYSEFIGRAALAAM